MEWLLTDQNGLVEKLQDRSFAKLAGYGINNVAPPALAVLFMKKMQSKTRRESVEGRTFAEQTRQEIRDYLMEWVEKPVVNQAHAWLMLEEVLTAKAEANLPIEVVEKTIGQALAHQVDVNQLCKQLSESVLLRDARITLMDEKEIKAIVESQKLKLQFSASPSLKKRNVL
jgi:hypothetical protein